MKNFVLIDFLTEKVKKLFELLENHNHDNIYVRKEDLKNDTIFKQNVSVLTFDYKLNEGSNAIVSGPLEIKGGVTLEVPKGSVLTIV